MNSQPYRTDRMNEYPDAILNAAETSEADIPTTPFPNPGKGGPADNGNGTDNGDIPVIPLPNPDEGGPVDSGNWSFPSIFRPILPGGTGGSVTVVPGITFPCSSYTVTNSGHIRFLNASTGYQPFYAYLGSQMVASGLASGDITSCMQSAFGAQTVTVSGTNRYVYIQRSIQVSTPSSMTTVIINTAGGLDIMEISDISCSAPSGSSRLRIRNLSQNLGPLDVSVGGQSSSYTAFTSVRYREVTPYISFYPRRYQLYIARTDVFPSIYIATATVDMSASISCTLYTFNAFNTIKGLRTMVASN